MVKSPLKKLAHSKQAFKLAKIISDLQPVFTKLAELDKNKAPSVEKAKIVLPELMKLLPDDIETKVHGEVKIDLGDEVEVWEGAILYRSRGNTAKNQN